MRVILDTLGGDHGAREYVNAAILAMAESDTEIVLVGNEEELTSLLGEADASGKYRDRIRIIPSTEVVDMNDDPVATMKEKPNSSMAVAVRALLDGEGDALVSSGNTGALLTQATLVLKRIRGIRRAALAPVTPTAKGKAVLIDSGANAECTPEYLYQFALMGSFYAELALGIKSPRVGLLNNGAEEHKGDELHREANKLLRKANDEGVINFIGNIEGRDGPLGEADVIVADGFSGNVYLKTMEGIGMFFSSELKSIFLSSLAGKLSALALKKAIGGFKKKVDYQSAGGAPLLGVRKPVIKAHGSAKAKAIAICISQARDYFESGMTEKIESCLKKEEKSDE